MSCSFRILPALVLISALWGPIELPAAPGAPNIVLIISDDHGWTDYGFQGHPDIETPQLDRLATQSAVFPRTYLCASVCRPSLASLITGLYPHEHGITGNDVVLPKNRSGDWRRARDKVYLAKCEELISNIEKHATLPRLLAKKGYVSFQSGKWWEGHFSRGGFTAGMTHGDPARGGRHGDEGLRIGRRGMKPVFDFIDSAGEKPFFVWYAPYLPHSPHNPPARILKKYKADGRPLAVARYYAMCEWFDETCGQLLDHIETRNLTQNTLVIYIADNGWTQRTKQSKVPDGWHTSYAPRSKQSPFDGGIRSPMLLCWPAVVKPGRIEALASSLDIAPTVLAAAGIRKTAAMSGLDLLPVCAGQSLKRNAVFGELYAHDIADIHHPDKTLMYRWCISGRYKIIRHYPGVLHRYKTVLTPTETFPQLYDIRRDPFERRNLAESMPDKVAELSEKLDKFRKSRTP